MSEGGQLDSRRIEIDFELCHHARTRPLNGGVKTIYPVEPTYDGHHSGYLDWLHREWSATGLCPPPGFFVATESEWLPSLSVSYRGSRTRPMNSTAPVSASWMKK